MSTSKLYAELYQQLNGGESAFILSEYKSDQSIDRQLVSNEELGQIASLTALRQSPDAVHHGSLSLLTRPEGSLFVIEQFMAKPRLVILGGGHVSLALAEIASLVDFDLTIYDDRADFANAERFPMAREVICDDFARLSQHLTFGPGDFVVDVTRGYAHDIVCLQLVLSGTEPTYTGMIGSERRVAIVMNELKEKGYDQQRLNRIHAPIGFDIGAQTPSEIAISIIAEVIAAKRKKQGEKPWISGDLELVEAVAQNGFVPEAVITVLATKGSVPTEVGCKLGVAHDGRIAGSIGGGSSEADAIKNAQRIIAEGGWELCDVDLTGASQDAGMVCGGEMQLLIERA